MGPKRVTQSCELKYMYDAKVGPAILDGGNDLSLANFHGPRSLKCDTKAGGLAKPAPKHTYAVLTREFLCDCQLDLEYASILKQISTCGEKTKYEMTLRFTVNLAFWQLLKHYKPILAKTVNPDLKRIKQTFPVKLFDNTKGPLQMPSVLLDIVKRLNDEGRKLNKVKLATPIFSKYESNIMTLVTGGLACLCTITILVIMVKQIRLQSLVSCLGLVSLIPPTKALYLVESLTKATDMPYSLAREYPQ